MSIILSLDPGTEQTAYCLYDTKLDKPLDFNIRSNAVMAALIVNWKEPPIDKVVCEMFACYGMAIGATTLEACTWVGSYRQACRDRTPGISFEYMYRKDVKLHLCGQARAKDANVRQALIDRFGKPGTIKNKGILYGCVKDMFAALAVAVTYSDLKHKGHR